MGSNPPLDGTLASPNSAHIAAEGAGVSYSVRPRLKQTWIKDRTDHTGCESEPRLGERVVSRVIDLVFNFVLICSNIFVPIKNVFKNLIISL